MTIKKQYVGNVRDLKVYRKALLLRKVIYEMANCLPEFEQENLGDILRSSSCSIVSNLAEGNVNFYYKKEYNHLNMSLSKIAELRAIMDVIRMEKYISASLYTDVDLKAEEILKMIIGMMNRIELIIQHVDDIKEIEDKLGQPSVNISELIDNATNFNNCILDIVKQYPLRTEKYNQIDQITRASKSILENLNNSKTTNYPQNFHFLNTALGSVSECRAFLVMGDDYMSKEQYHCLDKLGEEILGLIVELMDQIRQVSEGKSKVIS